MIDIANILTYKYPNTSWSLNGDSYENLVWYSTDIEKPKLEELESFDKEVKQIIKNEIRINELVQLLKDSDWTQCLDVAKRKGEDFVKEWELKRESYWNEIQKLKGN